MRGRQSGGEGITDKNRRGIKSFVNNNSCYTDKKDYSKKTETRVSQRIESVVGKMVVHSEMGTGVVIAENENILTVAFKTRGIKNVARDFVKFV